MQIENEQTVRDQNKISHGLSASGDCVSRFDCQRAYATCRNIPLLQRPVDCATNPHARHAGPELSPDRLSPSQCAQRQELQALIRHGDIDRWQPGLFLLTVQIQHLFSRPGRILSA